MTRIVGVDVLRFHRELDGRSWNPGWRWRARSSALFVVHLDGGGWGIGEAWTPPHDPGPVLALLADEIAPQFVGRDIDGDIDGDIGAPDDAASAQAAAAWSAVDMACWDARARLHRQPLWRALGGRQGAVQVYASGGLYRDGVQGAALADEMRAYLEAGHAAVKMKIGALGLDEDAARVHAVRMAIGPAAALWVDAVNRLGRDTAPAWCERLRADDVQAIQAPLPFDDIAGMAEIHRRLPVIAGEAEHRDRGFAALLASRSVGYLQFCLGLCGGFSGARRLCERAGAAGVPVTTQTHATAILQTATLHFSAAYPQVALAEYHEFHNHLRHLAPPAARRIVGGRIILDDTPGLGIEPPALGRHRDGSLVETFAKRR